MWILIAQCITLLMVLVLLWDHMVMRTLIADTKHVISNKLEKMRQAKDANNNKPAPPPQHDIDEFTTDNLEDISRMEML